MRFVRTVSYKKLIVAASARRPSRRRTNERMNVVILLAPSITSSASTSPLTPTAAGRRSTVAAADAFSINRITPRARQRFLPSFLPRSLPAARPPLPSVRRCRHAFKHPRAPSNRTYVATPGRGAYTHGEVTSQYLWLRYDRHFVGITWHNVWS